MIPSKVRLLLIAIGALTLVLGLAGMASAAGPGEARAVSIQGIVQVDGQDAVVDVLVVVLPGENARNKARAVLKRAYPSAREIGSAEYTTTGLVWDVFLDGDPGNDQVVVNYNPKGVPSNLTGHRTIWSTSQATWTSVGSSSFAFVDGGDTGRCPSLVKECKGRQKFDGNNDVGWGNISDPSVLGVTWFGTSTDEFDMWLDNRNFTWYIGAAGSIPSSSYDVETVWLHEFGHAVGLGHSNVQGAVMEPFYEGVRRALHSDDIAGITSLYASGPVNETPSVAISSPSDGSTFASGASISFAGAASDTEDGDLSGAISWVSSIDGVLGVGATITATLSDGNHTITASVTDSGGATGSGSVGITVGTVIEPDTVSVSFVTYATEGGKNKDKHLLITVALEDDLGDPVAGASVSIDLYRDGTRIASGSGATGTGGTLTFSLKNARSGVYTTTVTNVTAAGLVWDGVTPPNGFSK